MKTPTFIAALTVGAVLTLASAGAVNAQTNDATAPGPRIERLCARVPNLQIRTDNALTRINGDASTKGSLLWLDAQIVKADTRNRTDLAQVLRNRREVRAATVPVLESRSVLLTDLAQRCSAAGVS